MYCIAARLISADWALRAIPHSWSIPHSWRHRHSSIKHLLKCLWRQHVWLRASHAFVSIYLTARGVVQRSGSKPGQVTEVLKEVEACHADSLWLQLWHLETHSDINKHEVVNINTRLLLVWSCPEVRNCAPPQLSLNPSSRINIWEIVW